MTIYVKFVLIKNNQLIPIGDPNLSEAFLPIIGDSIRLTGISGFTQYRVVDRHFWIDEKDEKITIYVQESDSCNKTVTKESD